MNKCNSIKAIDKTDLSEQTKFRLDEINKIENYFIEEINQRKSCSRKLNKYVALFDYIDQALINCFKGNKCWCTNYFIYKYCWCTSCNSKCKSYFIFFCSNRTNKQIIEYNKKKKSWLKVNSIALKH